jgi:hypothetical protein
VILPLLLLTLSLQQGTDSVVARANETIKTLADTASVKRSGFRVLQFGQTRDLGPFQGQHWVDPIRVVLTTKVELAKPTFVMFLPVGDSLKPIGLAYSNMVGLGASLPSGLAGTPAEWHAHQFCRNVPGEGQVLADGTDDCADRGGTPVLGQIAMVHAWTVPNPDGPYAHDNPWLPFMATGLKNPPNPGVEARTFGLALAETYGARLPAAHRITREAGRTGKRGILQGPRDSIRALVPKLREAEQKGDTVAFAALRSGAMAQWALLLKHYDELAPTAEIKKRLGIEVAQATGESAHHHH